MAYDDLIAIIDYWNFRNLANREDKTLRRIDDGGEAVNAHAAKIGDSERAALKFFRLHSLVARAMREIFHQLADLPQRVALRRANDPRQQSIFKRDRDPRIDIAILYKRLATERGIHSRYLNCGLYRRF